MSNPELMRIQRARFEVVATALLFSTGGAAIKTAALSAAQISYLEATAPLYVLVLEPFLLGERFARRDMLYLGLLAVGRRKILLSVLCALCGNNRLRVLCGNRQRA